MALACSQGSFLASTSLAFVPLRYGKLLGCRASVEKDTDRSSTKEMKLAMVAVAAGLLTLGPVGDAVAAKTGGRVGGQAFRSSGPGSSGPRINNSRTNIFINPPVAPPLVGGYGFGVPFYGGGWGGSPFTFFAPGPSVAVGIGGGFEIFVVFLVLGAVASVLRRFFGRRDDEDEY